MEPLTGRLAKLRGKFQIMMSADGTHVAQISGQMGQLGLHVHPLGIPVLQRQNGTAMAKIMKPWRVPLGIEHLGADTKPMPEQHQTIGLIDFG